MYCLVSTDQLYGRNIYNEYIMLVIGIPMNVCQFSTVISILGCMSQ